MSRYIDADALITQDWFVEYIGNLEETQVKDIIQQCKWYVMKEPSIDIVRCGKCEKSFNAEGEWICNHLSGMVGLNVVVKADDFCSYGEREGE